MELTSFSKSSLFAQDVPYESLDSNLQETSCQLSEIRNPAETGFPPTNCQKTS